MKFDQAVKKVPGLEKAHRPGLRALRSQDRPHIVAEDTRRLSGSVDVDSALREKYPEANRWDFAITYKHDDRKDEFVYWVELHTANDSQVKVVIRKAQWLLEWLRGEGHALSGFEREVIWVSSGATSLSLSAPQTKQMAEVGLIHRGGKLRIRSKRND